MGHIQLQNSIKTEDELSDFLLGAISFDKIEAKLFEILYVSGLDDFPEDHLIKYTGFTKAEARKVFKELYSKVNGFYYINTKKTDKLIQHLKSLPIETYNLSEQMELRHQIEEAEKSVKHINGVSRYDSKSTKGSSIL
jgi:hypothetical protein